MKISIVIPVLDSHEVVRRQLLYMDSFLQDDTEVIIVDDGSDVPLENTSTHKNTKFFYTNDKRPWSWAPAVNRGSEIATGKYVMIFGVDHFVTPKLLEVLRNYDEDRMSFKRQFGVITEEGKFTQDGDILMAYGLPEARYKTKGVHLNVHPGMFAIKRELWYKLGMYREDLVHRPYPQGEERHFKSVWKRYSADKNYPHPTKPTMYMFPCGYFCGDVDFNPFNLFHNLSRATKNNRFNRKILEKLKEKK